MKKLIIVRHGTYGVDDHLNKTGKAQIEALSSKLQPHISGNKAKILSSTTDRARESAEILGALLKIEHELHEVLWSENDHPEDMPKALELVRLHMDKVDVLILVTHLEYAEMFPEYFGKHELKLEGGIDGYGIQKGQAWIIDCLTKKMSFASPA